MKMYRKHTTNNGEQITNNMAKILTIEHQEIISKLGTKPNYNTAIGQALAKALSERKCL